MAQQFEIHNYDQVESPNKHEDARLFELSHKDAKPKEIKMKGARLLRQVEEMTTNEDVFLDGQCVLAIWSTRLIAPCEGKQLE